MYAAFLTVCYRTVKLLQEITPWTLVPHHDPAQQPYHTKVLYMPGRRDKV